jgi:peptidoglycan/xylan/chitin deacetylase (PgdA/CDA1 family)
MKKVVVGFLVFFSVLALFSTASCSLGGQSLDTEPPTISDSHARPVDLQISDSSELDISKPVITATTKFIAPSYPARTLILMYHNITNLPRSKAGDYDRTIEDFENDLKYLKNNHYTVIGLDDLLKIQKGKLKVDKEARLAVITFDDGYQTAYTRAYPLLKKYDMKATFFIITSFVGTSGRLTWKQISQMSEYQNHDREHPFSIGSHTVDHRSLAYDAYPAGTFATHDDYLRFLNMELNQSRKALLSHIDQSVLFLSLPYGQTSGDQDIIDAAIRNHYSGIRTSEYGTAFGAFNAYNTDWNYKLPSLPMFGSSANFIPISIIPTYYNCIYIT